MVKTLSFQCRGLIPGQGTKVLHAVRCSQKNQKRLIHSLIDPSLWATTCQVVRTQSDWDDLLLFLKELKASGRSRLGWAVLQQVRVAPWKRKWLSQTCQEARWQK